MLKHGESDSALDAIIKAIEFDQSCEVHGEDEFKSVSGVCLYHALHGQISLDKKDYNEKIKTRKANGLRGGKPKEFFADDVKTLANELKKHGVNENHFKQVRVDAGGTIIYSFIDKNTEKMYLSKSNLFNKDGSRKKNR